MRVGIISGSSSAVEILREVLALPGRFEIVWVAAGAEALEMCRKQCPDLILLDPVIPRFDGAKVVTELLKNHSLAILIVTSNIAGSSGKVFETLSSGALDAVATPTRTPAGGIKGDRELIEKIALVAKLITPIPREKIRLTKILDVPPEFRLDLVAIGSSTGGPIALAQILPNIPLGLGVAVVIAQHLDRTFAQGLAEWLQEKCPLRVVTAPENEIPRADTIYLASTNDHLIIGPDKKFHYIVEPREIPYRPSVDVLFLSIERHWPKRGIAVLLTGMGRDGADGLLALKKAGWHTIGQDEKTSVVYGMPKAAHDLNAAVETLPIEKIGAVIVNEIKKRGR